MNASPPPPATGPFADRSGPGRVRGATAATRSEHRHTAGDVLRALRVYAAAAFGVAILGEYGEQAGARHA
ncbi:hypothetical protein [Streptomyces sp. NPDC058045]|uniref:hypothetical protein n=1 Tax=Streptomyces sp. NPDC058045 TaxID=3346311 RepID=UPI0036E98482